MYECVKAGENTYYMECPAKIGFIVFEAGSRKKVIVVDTGNDNTSAKKIIKTAEANGWDIECIFNTHSHADHIGGNAYLIDKLNVTAYTPECECSFISNTMMEPALLYGGFPPDLLKNKFFMAPPSFSLPMREMDMPQGLETVNLPGHCVSMAGIKSLDGIWFLGDALMGKEVLDKHPITYLYNIKAQLDLLDRLKNLDGELFIPAHAEPVRKLDSLIEMNRSRMYEIIDSVMEILREPKTDLQLQQKLYEKFGIKINFSQYYLVGSTVRSYVAYLLNEKEVSHFIKDNTVYFVSEKQE